MDSASTNAKFLWLYGPAGSGKTILCSHIIKSLQKSHSSFVFYHFSRLDEQSGGVPEDVVRRWIFQIAESGDYGLDLVSVCLNWRTSGWVLHPADIWMTFSQVVLQLKQCVFVLDGLDEYSRQDIDRQDFLKRFKRSLHRTSSMVILTSRDEPDIRK